METEVDNTRWVNNSVDQTKMNTFGLEFPKIK